MSPIIESKDRLGLANGCEVVLLTVLIEIKVLFTLTIAFKFIVYFLPEI